MAYLIHYKYKNRPEWNLTNPYTKEEYNNWLQTEKEICLQYGIDENKRIKTVNDHETIINIF